jgi:eukaryotic-like serine/threonine-protein kinase
MNSRRSKQRRSLWRTDWLAALLIVFGSLVLHQTTYLFDRLERRFFDFAATQTERRPSDKVVILAIDDQSLRNIGRWPWSRDVHAQVLDKLAAAQAKAVVHTTFFFEPQVDAGLQFVQQMEQMLAAESAADPLVARLRGLVGSAKANLDTDASLATSLQGAGNVLLPSFATPGVGLGGAQANVPRSAKSFDSQALRGLTFPPADGFQWPIPGLASRAVAVGHLNQARDEVDGVMRASVMFLDNGGRVFPGLGVLAAAHALNLDIAGIAGQADNTLALGGLRIPVDTRGQVFPQYYKGEGNAPAFVTDSFFDVYAGKIPASKYAGKVVIIGATAAGIGDQFVTPVGEALSPAVVMAHELSSLLSNHFFANPEWATVAQLGAFLSVVVFLMVGLPRLGGAPAAGITALLWLLLLVVEYLMVSRQHVWVPLVLPAATLVLGYLGLTTKRYLVTEAGKLKSDEESAETNRMMGLALQGQGQLDMAFDRFRRVPLSDAVMDNLLNLALDFERKRQFNKAEAVYQHMATFDPQFKDLQSKLKRVKSLSETVLLGGGGGGPGATVLLGDSGVEKPMLGRYQVDKELGKGAMGVVYLGKDPKIGRVVAIKTMALAREFEGDELDDARQRFFREAETAGRLQHQHIVTIFDAGEDHELAYIAMEFLKGKDLSDYTRAGHLLTIAQVISIVTRVADALDYAHQLNVVHRDIKPANVMYDAASDTVKVTDFGIARVTDASRTRTGMVLGTPSFMSPEQIAGKKVDGRSDLYSLGVMTFQLLTGALPFRAESMAELMFKIANETAPDVRSVRADIPMGLATVVSKAMAKGLDLRYARGSEMAEDLRRSGTSNHPPPVSTVSDSSSFDETQPVSSGGFATTVVMSPSSERSE